MPNQGIPTGLRLGVCRAGVASHLCGGFRENYRLAGKPIPHAELYMEQDGLEIASVKTDTAGNYRIGVFPAVRISESAHEPMGELTSSRSTLPVAKCAGEDACSSDEAVVQVSRTTLSDEGGRYQFINLKLGRYWVRCQILDGYVYYGSSTNDSSMEEWKDGREQSSNHPTLGLSNEVAWVECEAYRNHRNPQRIETTQPSSPQTAIEEKVGEILPVEKDKTLSGIDFRFPPFKKGTWRNYTPFNGLANNDVRAIHRAPDGMMWFGTLQDVSRYDGKSCVNFTAEDGLAHDTVYAIHGDTDGVMWFGTLNGVSRYDGRQFVNFTTSDGLAYNYVQVIHCDLDGVMWFGTGGGGVSHYDGKGFVNLTTEDGLARNNVSFIYQAADGLIWFATRGSGVSAYDGTAWTSLDTRDGLAGNVFGKAICQNSEGVLRFGTDGGITRYRRSAVKPTVRILSVQAEKLYTADDHTGKFLQEIPPITAGTLVTISYNAIDTKTIPEKRQYRCRIFESTEGFLPSEGVIVGEKSNEIESSDTKTTYNSPTKEARFQWVPQKAGTYTFEVQAIDRDLNYSEPTAVHLTVQPDPRDIALAALQTEVNHLRREVARKYNFENIIGRSAAIKQVTALMEKAIDSGLIVLITGETGTGKELVAKAIHYKSPRKAYQLQELNCGAIPKELVASTLFGHRKGAFTGANEERAGTG